MSMLWPFRLDAYVDVGLRVPRTTVKGKEHNMTRATDTRLKSNIFMTLRLTRVQNGKWRGSNADSPTGKTRTLRTCATNFRPSTSTRMA